MLLLKNRRTVLILTGFHIFIIASSNFLVKLPIAVFGFNSTWGAFSYPFIFLTTDLTVRIFGPRLGRRIIFYAMIPALFVSYFVSVIFQEGAWMGLEALNHFNLFAARIAFASFSAYVIGQIIDVYVFNKLRKNPQWWHAPLASAILGNLIDTVTFSFIAFYKTSNLYFSDNLVEIAAVDYTFKILINTLFFLPLYKVVLNWIMIRLKKGAGL